MYPINSNVLSIFQNGSKQYFRMTIGSTVIDGSRVMQGSCSINRYVQTNESVAIGSVVASELTLSLNNYDGTYDNTDFIGSEAYVEIGVEDTNHTVQYIPMGYFAFDEATRTKNTISLAALDRMTKFDIPVNASQLSFPYTLTNLLSRICTLCSVTKGSFGTITNSSYSVASLPSEAKTYRDLLRWICELSGSNAYISYDGKLYLGWYGTTSQFNILPSNRTSSDIDKNTFTITGVTILTGDNQKYTAGTNVRPITINNNPFITTTQAQSVANTLNTKLGGFSYCPFTAVMLPSPMIYPMDRATFTTADGTTVAVSVTEVTYKLNGNTSIGCKGEMQVRGRSYGLADQTFYASNIAAGAVTADKISVDDLAALQATIGGWTINETNLASSNNAVVLNSAGTISVTETGSTATGAKVIAETSTEKGYHSAWGVRVENKSHPSTEYALHDKGGVFATDGTNSVSLTKDTMFPSMELFYNGSTDKWKNEQTAKEVKITCTDTSASPTTGSQISLEMGNLGNSPKIIVKNTEGGVDTNAAGMTPIDVYAEGKTIIRNPNLIRNTYTMPTDNLASYHFRYSNGGTVSTVSLGSHVSSYNTLPHVKNAIRVTNSGTSATQCGFCQDGLDGFMVGRKYTMSAWIRSSHPDLAITFQPLWKSSTQHAGAGQVGTTSLEWMKYTFTGVVVGAQSDTYSAGYIYVVLPANGGWIEVCGLKLEEGSVATPWSLAVEDVAQKSGDLDMSGKFKISNANVTQVDNTAGIEVVTTGSWGTDTINMAGSHVKIVSGNNTAQYYESSLSFRDSGGLKTQLSKTALKVNTHDLLRMSPHFAQMFATEIPANANLNTTTYLSVGQYYCSVSPSSFSNCPTTEQFVMCVEAMIYNTYDDELATSDKYRVRKITTFQGNQYIQRCVKPSNSSWTYGAWRKVVTTADVTSFSTSSTEQTTTTFAATSVHFVVPTTGYYIIEAALGYRNSAPREVGILQYSSGTNWRNQYAHQETATWGSLGVGMLACSFCGYLYENYDLYVWARSASNASNDIYMYAKKLP